MYSDRQNLVKVLETELRFLESRGYRNPEMWRPQFIFLDSPTCVHPAGSGRPGACSDCPLIEFVPEKRRSAQVPCHHIPLTDEGFTIDSLMRWGTQEELEDALRVWLKKKIKAMKEPQSESLQDAAQHDAEVFCGHLAE